MNVSAVKIWLQVVSQTQFIEKINKDSSSNVSGEIQCKIVMNFDVNNSNGDPKSVACSIDQILTKSQHGYVTSIGGRKSNSKDFFARLIGYGQRESISQYYVYINQSHVDEQDFGYNRYQVTYYDEYLYHLNDKLKLDKIDESSVTIEEDFGNFQDTTDEVEEALKLWNKIVNDKKYHVLQTVTAPQTQIDVVVDLRAKLINMYVSTSLEQLKTTKYIETTTHLLNKQATTNPHANHKMFILEHDKKRLTKSSEAVRIIRT